MYSSKANMLGQLPERKTNFLKQIQRYIADNIHDQQFDVNKLAELACLSVSQLNRKLNSVNSIPAGQLIREKRLNHARDLLLNYDFTVSEVAYSIGFNNQGNFCRSFKQRFGYSPTEYIKHYA